MKTLPSLHKYLSPLLPRNATAESSFVVDRFGRRLIVSFNRPEAVPKSGLTFWSWDTGTFIKHVAWSGGMGEAVNIGGTIYIYGTSPVGAAGDSVIVSTLDDNLLPSVPRVITTAPSNVALANVTVTQEPGPNGYVLAMEQYINGSAYPLSFIQSASPFFTSWTPLGIMPAGYTHPASIVYRNGFFYVTVGLWDGVWGSAEITRSATLLTGSFQMFTGNAKNPAGTVVLTHDFKDEPIAGDISPLRDLGDGTLGGIYLANDQVTYSEINKILYIGTMDDYLAEWF